MMYFFIIVATSFDIECKTNDFFEDKQILQKNFDITDCFYIFVAKYRHYEDNHQNNN